MAIKQLERKKTREVKERFSRKDQNAFESSQKILPTIKDILTPLLEYFNENDDREVTRDQPT